MLPLKPRIPLHRTCKQATILLVSKEDRQLPWNDRLALRIHLWICKACPRLERQILWMRRSLSDWRNEIKK